MANNITKKCYTIPQEVLGNLSIAYDTAYSTIVLWCKNQLFIYNEGDLRSPICCNVKFSIKKVLIYKKCILCVDDSNIININELRSHSTQQIEREFGFLFLIKYDRIISCEILNTSNVVSLVYDSDKKISKLYVNEFNMEFLRQNQFQLCFPVNYDMNLSSDEVLMAIYNLKADQVTNLKHIFDVTNYKSECSLLIFSHDKINIYACLIPKICKTKDEQRELKVVKVKTKTWWKFFDIKITAKDEISILLGLSAGSIVKVPLTKNNMLNKIQKPEVFHLNTPLYKFTSIANTVIFTDGLTMWKNDDLYTKTNFSFQQFFVRNVRDFCVMGNRIICITFTNLIYTFSTHIEPSDSGSSFEASLLASSGYIDKISGVIQQSDEIRKKIDKESEYLTALALSKRQDVMDSFIQVTAYVYDTYRDLIEQNVEVTLAGNEYFESQPYYFLICFSVMTIQHKLNKLLSDVLGDIKIHITLFKDKILKTTSIELKEQFKKKNFAISLKKCKIQSVNGIQVQIKIITSIPGKLDEKQRQWVVLYRKILKLNAGQFIKTTPLYNSICLKKDDASLETLIYQKAKYLHGTIHKFKLSDEIRPQWSFFLKLPENYKQILTNAKSYKNLWDSRKIDLVLNQLNIDLFSISKNYTEFEIDNDKVVLSMEDNGTIMRVSCPDIYIAFDMRKLFSEIIFATYKGCRVGNHFVNRKLQDDIKKLCRTPDNQDFFAYFLVFQKTVFGSLPL